MRVNIFMKTWLVLILIYGTISVANAGITLRGEKSLPRKMKFDGIWVSAGNVTLIKQLDGYVILQGKDEGSTWWARGVINGNQLICRGAGIGNAGQFVYESTMNFENGILKDSWKAVFAEGKEVRGDNALNRVDVERPDKTLPATR